MKSFGPCGQHRVEVDLLLLHLRVAASAVTLQFSIRLRQRDQSDRHGLPFKYRPSFAVGALMLTWGIAVVFGLLALLGRWEEQSFLRDSVAATGEVRVVRVRVKLDDKDHSSHRTEHYRLVVVFLAGGDEVEFEGRNETLDENKWQVG